MSETTVSSTSNKLKGIKRKSESCECPNGNGEEELGGPVDFKRGVKLENSETTVPCPSKDPEERRRYGAIGKTLTLRKCLLCPSFGLLTPDQGELHRMYRHQRTLEEEMELCRIPDQVPVVAYICTECPHLIVPESGWEAHRTQHKLGYALAKELELELDSGRSSTTQGLKDAT